MHDCDGSANWISSKSNFGIVSISQLIVKLGLL
jgi:hypothetical protein